MLFRDLKSKRMVKFKDTRPSQVLSIEHLSCPQQPGDLVCMIATGDLPGLHLTGDHCCHVQVLIQCRVIRPV
jgi:hypothetical protein